MMFRYIGFVAYIIYGHIENVREEITIINTKVMEELVLGIKKSGK